MLTAYAKNRMKQNTVPVSYEASCDQCEAIGVNGVLVHEHGCPEAWKDYRVECAWCGQMFDPEEKGQLCCDESCSEAYFS